MHGQLNFSRRIGKSGLTGSGSKQETFFQPKLTINKPDDPYEKEADAVADTVMRMENSTLQRKSADKLFFNPVAASITPVQRKCAHCEEEEKKSDSYRMQRKEINNEETAPDNNLESYVGNLNGSGQPLPNEVRSFYEPRFGYDFSDVKIHTDGVAAKSAQSINALAYTSGSNIIFNNGQYSPQTDIGKRLLGHELTHVVQQRATINKSSNLQKMGTDEEDVVMRKTLPITSFQKTVNAVQRQNPPAAPAIAAAPHPRAAAALTNMTHFRNDENILFDWWANDCRDNDRDGLTDSADPNEGGSVDGAHFNGTYPGYIVQPGVTCRSSDGGFYTTTRRVDIPGTVKYRVCADLISQAWTDAGVSMGHIRSVVSIINYIQHDRHWSWWPIESFRGPFIPGDLLFSRHAGLGHSTMVVSVSPAGSDPMIIHLPGQTQLISTGLYRPHIANDLQIQPWWPGRTKYGVGRYTG